MPHGTGASLGAELLEPSPQAVVASGAADELVQEGDDVVIPAEVPEMGEREVDGPGDGPGGAQPPELVELALPAGHVSAG
jgi:hypothetical protein